MADEIIDINFVDTDSEFILSRLLNRFEQYTGEVLSPGDERRMFLQCMAYVLSDEALHINETGKGNMLRFANDEEVDALGELFNNPRLEAEKATVTIKIIFSESMSFDITIPKGTRVTADGVYLFAIDEDVVLTANSTELEKTVTATAIEAGAGYNGFAVGQINRIVDTNPYIYSVSNIDTSSGGTDIEDDESYKERLRLEPFTFSTAGSSEAYKAIALSVSNLIGDVHVHSPSPGVVEIVVVLKDGVIPDADSEILQEILTACSDRTVRPLTDYVQVVPATELSTGIVATYYVANGDTSVIPAIMQAVDDYKVWQTEKIGRAVNPDYLRKLMFNAGASKVEITSPVPFDTFENQVVSIASESITYGGSITM